MTIEVRAPLTEAAPSGVVLQWRCKVGDRVRKGDALGEIETDKANLELEAPADGVIEAVLVAVGEVIGPDTVLARLAPRRLGEARSDHETSGRAPAQHAGGREGAGQPAAPRVEAAPPARCRFCHAREILGRVDCARCGAPS